MATAASKLLNGQLISFAFFVCASRPVRVPIQTIGSSDFYAVFFLSIPIRLKYPKDIRNEVESYHYGRQLLIFNNGADCASMVKFAAQEERGKKPVKQRLCCWE